MKKDKGPEDCFGLRFLCDLTHQLQFPERFNIWRTQNAAFGDDCRYIFCRSNIEGRVRDSNAMRRELLSAVMSYFDGRPLLDGDGVAGLCSQVDGGPGRGDIKRDAVLAGQDGDVVSTDLVGEIPVGGNAIG